LVYTHPISITRDISYGETIVQQDREEWSGWEIDIGGEC